MIGPFLGASSLVLLGFENVGTFAGTFAGTIASMIGDAGVVNTRIRDQSRRTRWTSSRSGTSSR
jgi:hypothetical protein